MQNSLLVALLLTIAAGYLLGSVPTAYVIGRLHRIDIFKIGSGNMGATNISRALGIPLGIVVWFMDSAKGMAAILLAQQLMPENPALGMTAGATSAIIGHNWSIIVLFLTGSIRGGKGAATAFGTLLMLAPAQVVAISFALCSAAVVLTRYMSLGVLLLFGLSLPWLFVLTMQDVVPSVYSLYAVATAALIFYRFRENIMRLANGTERRLGDPA